MHLCDNSTFQNSASDCSNFGAAVVGLVVTAFTVYFSVQVLPQSCRGLSVILFQILVLVNLMLSATVVIFELIVNSTTANSIGPYVILVSRIVGWIVTFQLTHKLLSCSQAKLMFASATWCLTQIVSSGFSVHITPDSDTNDVTVNLLLICYCLVSVLVLIILSVQMCK